MSFSMLFSLKLQAVVLFGKKLQLLQKKELMFYLLMKNALLTERYPAVMDNLQRKNLFSMKMTLPQPYQKEFVN